MIFRKINNKILELYEKIFEWLYIRLNKTTYWEYELESGIVYCTISGGKMYITLNDYRILERDIIGRKMLKEFKDNQVPIKIII